MSRYRLHMTTVVCLAGLLLAIGCDTAWTESPDSIVTIPSQRPYENPGVIMGDPGSDIGPLTVQVFSPIKRGALGRNGRRDPVEGARVTFKFKEDWEDFLFEKKPKKKPASTPEEEQQFEAEYRAELEKWKRAKGAASKHAPKILKVENDSSNGVDELTVTTKEDGLATVWVKLGNFVGSYRLEAQFDNNMGLSKNVNFWLYSGVKVVPELLQREGPSGSKIDIGVQVKKISSDGKPTEDNDCDVWFQSNAKNKPFWRSENTEDEGSARIEITLGPRTGSHQVVAELEPKKTLAPIRGVVIDYYSLNWAQVALYALAAMVFVVVGLRLMGSGLVVALHPVLHLPTGDFTRGKMRGFLGGVMEGALFLSSSAVNSRLVHFANGGLLMAAGAAAQLLGAQLGKSILLQVLAFNLVTVAAMPLIALGAGLRIFSGRSSSKYWGSIFMGLGLVVLGWVVFLELAAIAWNSPTFTQTLQTNWDPLAGDGHFIPLFLRTVLYATLLSTVLRSSTLLVLPAAAFAGTGVISPVAFLAVLAGSAMGATLGVFIASLRRGREARRTALVSFVFQAIGAVWLSGLSWISVPGESLPLVMADNLFPGELFHSIPENVTNHLATSQTLFHLINGVLLLAILPLALRLVDRILPRDPVNDDVKPYRLDPNLAEVPSLGLAQATREAVYLVELIRKTLAESFDTFRYQDLNLAEQISRRDESIMTIQREISQYLMDLARSTLSQKEVSRLHILQAAVGNLVRLVKDGEALREQTLLSIEEKIETPEEALRDLTELYELLMAQFENVLQILENPDRRVEETAVKLGERLARSGTRIEAAWLQKATPGEVPTTAFLISREAYRTLANATGHLAHIAERMRVLASR